MFLPAYTLYCRTVQNGIRLLYTVLKFPTPDLYEGTGSIKSLAERIHADGVKRVLFVTGSTIRRIGLCNPLLNRLSEFGISYTLFSDLAPDPTDRNVEEGAKAYRTFGCDAIVAFGGGGPMDCAKAIGARIARPDRPVQKLQGFLRVKKRIPPLYCVPTTSGTGSETTIAAVVTDSKTHRKASISDPVLMPKAVALDPLLTVGLPPRVTAETGLDALCHAVETYTNGRYCTDEENAFAREAVRLIHENLLRAYENGEDLQARAAMQKAAFLAGRAFTRGGVGYVHAIGHPLGGLYGIAHGRAMGILLPHVLRAYGSAAHQKLSELAAVCGMIGENDAARAEAFLAWIETLKERMQIPRGVDCIRSEDIDQMVAWARAEANPVYPVPVVWDKRQIRALIESVRM